MVLRLQHPSNKGHLQFRYEKKKDMGRNIISSKKNFGFRQKKQEKIVSVNAQRYNTTDAMKYMK